jgi:hypothetical protein
MRTGKSVFIAAILAICMNCSARAQTNGSTDTSGSASAQGVRAATVLTIHGKVSAVEKAKSLVTLDVNGRTVTLKVDNPVNLEAAKVGTPVVVRYYEIVSIRKKKPGEDIPSISVKDGIVTAEPGGPGGAVASQEARVLVTVNAVDTANGILTLQGPDGAAETVKARDPRNLRHLKAGDELVVSVSRATAISLEKDSSN